MGSTGFAELPWFFLDSSGFLRVLPGFYWVVPGNTGFESILPG